MKPDYQGALDMATRMLLFATIHEDKEHEFETAFAEVRRRVATVDGHINDQLLRQRDEPGRYLLVSDWDSRAACLEWLESPLHHEMTGPVQPYFARRSDLRFYDVKVG
jgi:heme-degrading monooxygenase HmoA